VLCGGLLFCTSGISAQQLPASSLKFLTRLHYCAPDSGTYGADAPWGEHEVDYILLAQVGGGQVKGAGG